MTEDEMVGRHHQLNGHDFEQALGGGEGQGNLACCIPWGHKESDTTEQLNDLVTEQQPPPPNFFCITDFFPSGDSSCCLSIAILSHSSSSFRA